MSFRLTSLRRRSINRARDQGRSRRRRWIWALEDLEERALLSGNPTIYTVTDTSDDPSDTGSFRNAINQANANTNPAGSLIRFDPTVFDVSRPQPAPSGTIRLNSTLELSEKAGPEMIDGPGVNNWGHISGNGITGTQVTVFKIATGVTAILSGLSIGSGNSNSHSLTAGYSTSGGGGIDNEGTLTVNDCIILGNDAWYGGGLYNSGILTVNGSRIDGNSAGYGGGIYNYVSGTLKVEDSNLEGNDTGVVISFGGGSPNECLSCGGGIYNLGTFTSVNSTFVANTSDNGGAIYNVSGTMTIVNGTITGNSLGNAITPNGGGGLVVEGGTIVLNNTIVARNFTGTGSGAQASDIVGTVSSSSAYNLIGTGGSGGLQNGVNGNLVGVANPGLGSLTFLGLKNGVPTIEYNDIPTTEYVPLLSGSPAIGAGRVALAVDPTSGLPLTTDQRGAGFARTFNNTVDIGAYESFSTYTPPRTGPVGPGSSSSNSIVGEGILTSGQGKHKHLVGFKLIFNAALDVSRARNAANYRVTQTVKLGRKTVTQRVRLRAEYNAASNTVSLLLSGKRSFVLGGQIVVNSSPPNGISDSAGDYLVGGPLDLPGIDPVFVIRPNGRGVVG